VAWLPPRQRQWIILLLLTLCAAALWVLQLPYAEKVTVEGVVQPRSAPVVVRSQVGGIVRRLHIGEGVSVHVDQALLLVDRRQAGPDGQSDLALRRALLTDELRALSEQRARTEDLAQRQHRLLQEELHSTTRQRLLLTRRLAMAEQQAVLLGDAQQRLQTLAAEQWLAAADAQAGQAAHLDAQQLALARRSEQLALLARQQQLQLRLDLQQAEYADRLAEIAANKARLRTELKRLGVAQQTLTTASVDGVVTDLTVSLGEHVQPGTALLTITPEQAGRYRIDALLPPAAAAKVRPGMAVRLRYAGYPLQHYGSARGTVRNVSPAPAADGPALHYRAHIDVLHTPAAIDNVPAGLVVTVDVLLESHRLWRWLVQPLHDVLTSL